MEESRNGWEEWGKYVLKELERQNDCNAFLTEAVNSIKVDLAMLKLKSGIWGFLAGTVPPTGLLLYFLIKELMKK